MARAKGLNFPAGESVEALKLRRGTMLGKYRLEKHIASGGFSEIWKATDSVEGLVVALKIPLANVDGKRDNNSILREVRLISRLRHPNIMPLKNAEIINGHAVLATELSVDTLSDRSKPMSVRRIITIVDQVLKGLAHAHNNRIVHCDVAPSNIFLFPHDHAALGDFGIGLHVRGKMKTIDEFGTPGYVAPEQAYGKPTYRSDCFSVGIILYEYLTGTVPEWPFKWPPRGYNRLLDRTNTKFAKFIKKAIAIDPGKRYPNAERMHIEMHKHLPAPVRQALSTRLVREPQTDWQQLRRETFTKRYSRIFPSLSPCQNCREPVSEYMSICPWCGYEKNRFDETTMFTHLCPECHRGVLPQWKYCPWCYKGRFEPQAPAKAPFMNMIDHCKKCGHRLAKFMKYCPDCHAKVKTKWQAWPFPDLCTSCGWSVDASFWNYCPWCKQRLI